MNNHSLSSCCILTFKQKIQKRRKRYSDKEDNSSSDAGYVGTDRTLTLGKVSLQGFNKLNEHW